MPTIGNLGTLYVRNKQGELEEVPVICGKDGETPYIGDNGNWWIGGMDTGTCAKINAHEITEDELFLIIAGMGASSMITASYSAYELTVTGGTITYDVSTGAWTVEGNGISYNAENGEWKIGG